MGGDVHPTVAESTFWAGGRDDRPTNQGCAARLSDQPAVDESVHDVRLRSMDAGGSPVLHLRPLRRRCGRALLDPEASAVHAGCFGQAVGEVWATTQPAEVIDCV